MLPESSLNLPVLPYTFSLNRLYQQIDKIHYNFSWIKTVRNKDSGSGLGSTIITFYFVQS